LIANRSNSIAAVLRNLGFVKWGGGHHRLIRDRLREYEIDTSHFLGRGMNAGDRHRGGPRRKPWYEVLVKRDSGIREKSYRLRRALIESGVKYECECGIEGLWRGKLLRLEVDHVNGDFLDCRKENLRFLCPNCHSQRVEAITELTTEAAIYRRLRLRRHGEMVDPQR
jgi:hypothetical protein